MSRQITVKVATSKVIKALEARLATLENDYSTQTAKEAKFGKAQEAWRKEIGKWAIANFSKAENLRTNYRSWNNTLNVDFDIITKEGNFPAEPEKDFEVIHQHQYREMKEDITNALTILKMTDEETVNASTMKQIAKYL
jgi:predicted ribosome quality control (RQC) complex YloA/Tae2 family protein